MPFPSSHDPRSIYTSYCTTKEVSSFTNSKQFCYSPNMCTWQRVTKLGWRCLLIRSSIRCFAAEWNSKLRKVFFSIAKTLRGPTERSITPVSRTASNSRLMRQPHLRQSDLTLGWLRLQHLVTFVFSVLHICSYLLTYLLTKCNKTCDYWPLTTVGPHHRKQGWHRAFSPPYRRSPHSPHLSPSPPYPNCPPPGLHLQRFPHTARWSRHHRPMPRRPSRPTDRQSVPAFRSTTSRRPTRSGCREAPSCCRLEESSASAVSKQATDNKVVHRTRLRASARGGRVIGHSLIASPMTKNRNIHSINIQTMKQLTHS